MIKNILSTYHHSFAGGSKNTSRLLHYFSDNGGSVDAFFFETPQFFKYTASKVNVHTLPFLNVHSEVIDPLQIRNYAMTNHIVNEIKKKPGSVLFAANLFPYCDIMLEAKAQAIHAGYGCSRLVLHPVGSDIWQIGPQIKARVKWLLDNPLVDSIVTYSDCLQK
jgi:hypothetical protein